MGEIHVLEENFVDATQWNRYLGVLAGGYLYLYARSSDPAFSHKLYLRNSLVVDP